MAQVTVSIDGKTYRMACDEGQEEHLIDLAERFDRYVQHLKDSFGEIGDQRITVMAGIMVMDELAELQKRVRGMEGEIATLRKTRDDALLKADKNDAALTGGLAELAERIEAVAARLSASEPPRQG
ncbi:cell division protein ZapA [Nitratireductor luteus]|uniref:cell division protein ZapA n=1 Tax=Nitratireductor luteus TaxID=2976980 RepID=UPI002240A579|nr:cell division protein ZapA [Nitratireductor luteus]